MEGTMNFAKQLTPNGFRIPGIQCEGQVKCANTAQEGDPVGLVPEPDKPLQLLCGEGDNAARKPSVGRCAPGNFQGGFFTLEKRQSHSLRSHFRKKWIPGANFASSMPTKNHSSAVKKTVWASRPSRCPVKAANL